MKTILVILATLVASAAWAQAPSIPQPVIDMETQLKDVGCNAERLAAAQEIMRLRDVNTALEKQVTEAQKKADPPADPPTATATLVPKALPTPSPYESPAWTPSPLPTTKFTAVPMKK